MRGLFLILKNSFKNVFKNKFQIFGLTLLVALLALIVSLMASINARVIESYNSLINASNAHNVVLQMDPFEQVPTAASTGESPDKVPENNVEAQQFWLYELQDKYYRAQNNLQFEWSRTEAREFSQVFDGDTSLTIKTIAKVTPQNVYNQNPVDGLVIFKGREIRSDRQVVIDPVFAEQHGIQLGEIIRIQSDHFGNQLLVSLTENSKLLQDIEKMRQEGLDNQEGVYQQEYSKNYDWYQVVGFGGSADFMMPVINASSVLPNRKTELLVYVHPTPFGLTLATDRPAARKGIYNYNPNTENGRKLTVSSNNEWESFYSLKLLNNDTPSAGQIQQMNDDFNQILQKMVSPKTYFYSSDDPNYRFANRTLTINETLAAYNISSAILEILFAIIVFYSVGLVTRKQIEKVQGQVGTLKALGYMKRELVLNFVMMPFFTAFLGGIIGFAVASGLSQVLVSVFASYFLLNYGIAHFDWWGLVLSILLLWLILTSLAFLITFIILQKKDTLSLINARQMSKASRYGRTFKDKRKNVKIGSKITSALLADATGKMSVVGVVVLLATMVFTMAFAAPDILRRNQVASYTGVKYKQIVEYSDPVYNNPLTFYKTYNHEATSPDPVDPDEIFKYSQDLDGFTAMPLNKIDDENYGGYNVDRIMADYYANNIDNEFYSLFLANQSDEGETPLPEIAMSNMRFLQGRDIGSSTDYYRFMASYGMKGSGLLDKTLLSQWPDYNELIAVLSSDEKSLVEIFDTFQTFYSKYVNSIGLSITNDYYDPQQVGHKASDDEKIQSFNEVNQSSDDFSNILQTIKQDQGGDFNSELQNLTIDNEEFKFNFTTSDAQLGAFHMTDAEHNAPDAVNDYFLGINSQRLANENPEEFKQTLIKFILWFGTLFSVRGDQGIIQAAYFRPPYFVQQFFKQAYFEKEPYVQGFGVVSYNPELEQVGTRMNVQSNGGNAFKIYGIQRNSDRFLDLKNEDSDNLIADLYRQRAEHGIIINQSVAKILNLKTGDKVNLKVLQDELREKSSSDEIKAVGLDKWKVNVKREGEDKGFVQLNNLGGGDIFRPGVPTTLTSSFGGGDWSISPTTLFPNSPSEVYDQVLQGNLLNSQLESDVKFQVVAIHDGYGVPQAWIKEDEAQEILKFDEVKKFAWSNWFVHQWGNEFSQDHHDQPSNFEFNGIQGLDFTNNPPTYDQFVNNYLNNPSTRRPARIIMDIFNNAFPIFNYKYSNKDDVGDLKSLVAIFQKYGDYSPIGMQGITADGRGIRQSYEGVGQGAIDTVIPVEISKAILAKISDLVMFVLILAIIAILLITFVIIFLTTALIIDDNARFIASMKVLGYSNRYISSKVLGMYFVVIGSVFVVGFIAGWFIFAAVVEALVPAIVLPLKFQIWLPFVVLMGVVGIYLITIFVGFRSISKTNAVAALQSNDL